MTTLREQRFAEEFSALVARASSEPFVELTDIGRYGESPVGSQLQPAVEEPSRGRR
ncbi:hypothetical protein [Pengzhenrongella sicca]|uniref:Uncharacterized protein n=1 Tax=Pengzhenrongella sicca TaxID=2819238 RepID=A0A8A4ZBY5_9MICO|nr:hypothetical protein [Pengzhenrongella sicca]QTE28106.1 hypothetical protein J4E96_11965 [Pengzhenrongella sicca]